VKHLALFLISLLLAGPALADKSVGTVSSAGASGGDSSIVAVGGVGDALSLTGLEDVRTAFDLAERARDREAMKELADIAVDMAKARNTKVRRAVVFLLGWLPFVGPLI
jgi:hypothetical protein